MIPFTHGLCCCSVYRRALSSGCRAALQCFARSFCLCAILVFALLGGAPSVLSAQPTGQTPPRGQNDREYSFKDFSGWLLHIIPELNTHPTHFILVIDRTDSVWGGNVLPTVWRRDLMGMMLQEFLVEGIRTTDSNGHPINVDGDSISLGWHGQRRTEQLLWHRAYQYRDRSAIEARYAELMPFRDTPPKLQNTYLDQASLAAAGWVKETMGTQNTVLLLVTDDAQEGEGSHSPAEMPGFRKDSVIYTGRGDNNQVRKFRIYAYWNNFPDSAAFTRYDTRVHQVLPEMRLPRVEMQARNNGLPPGTTGTTRNPPPDSRPDPSTAFWTSAATVGLLLLLIVLWRDWYGSYYQVEIAGLPTKVWVFPTRRTRPVKLPNPNFEEGAGETLGTLVISGPGLLRLHRLALQPDRRYELQLAGRGTPVSGQQPAEAAEQGTAPKAAGRRTQRGKVPTALLLAAGTRQPVNNEIVFASASKVQIGALPVGQGAPADTLRSGQVTLPAQNQPGLGRKKTARGNTRSRSARRSRRRP